MAPRTPKTTGPLSFNEAMGLFNDGPRGEAADDAFHSGVLGGVGEDDADDDLLRNLDVGPGRR